MPSYAPEFDMTVFVWKKYQIDGHEAERFNYILQKNDLAADK